MTVEQEVKIAPRLHGAPNATVQTGQRNPKTGISITMLAHQGEIELLVHNGITKHLGTQTIPASAF